MTKDEQRNTAANRNKIIFDIGPIDPELNPRDPNFNIDKWANGEDPKEKIVKTGERAASRITEFTLSLANSLRNIIDTLLPPQEFIDYMQSSLQLLEEAATTQQAIDAIEETAQKLGMEKELEDFSNYLPLLTAELEKPVYKGYTLEDLQDMRTDEEGNIIEGNLLDQAISNVLKNNNLPRVKAKNISALIYPLDKISAGVFGSGVNDSANMVFKAEKKGSKKQADLVCNIDFGAILKDISISNELGSFDKRCYMAISSLYNAGNEIITISQIYRAMGNSGEPGRSDREKIHRCYSKMAAITINLDNTSEHKLYPNRAKLVYGGSMLPLETMSAYVNNQLVDGALHLFREPPVMWFAKERGQVTTIKKEVLESPLSQTESNLRLEDYLIRQIAHIKNGKIRNRMLYNTIFNAVGITSKMQKNRAPEKINKCLQHYKQVGFINGFKADNSGIDILY